MCHDEQTLDELLSDPITLSLMTADGVDREALFVDLKRIAGRLRERPRSPHQANRARAERLIADCIGAAQGAGRALTSLPLAHRIRG